MSVNAVSYPGCYATANVGGVSSTQANPIVAKLKDEIAYKQAYVKVEFLQNTLEKHKDMNLAERNAVEGMLRDAQREIAQLKQQLDAKYPVNA